MEAQEFFEKAKEQFGDKIRVQKLPTPSDDDLEKLDYTKEAFENYPEQAWIFLTKDKGYLCPVCSEPLGGLLGSFTWGIQHGVGFCSNCKKASFQLYHYIEEGKRPLELFALCGF